MEDGLNTGPSAKGCMDLRCLRDGWCADILPA